MPAISIMIKPASSLCNMRCDYCFYHDVAKNREKASFGMMEKEMARQIIDKALDYAQGGRISFAFQGGEPLLAGLPFFKAFVSYVMEKNLKKCTVDYAMQTNGLLINKTWIDFFKKEGFLLGLSLDGNYKANQNRKKANGQSSYHSVLQAAELLNKNRIPTNILTVLTGDCADNIEEIYKFFKNRGFKFLQFIPCLRPFGDNSEGSRYMTNEQYAEFLIKLFKLYVNDYTRGHYISVRQFDNMVRLFLGQRAEQCGMSGRCSFQYVVESNGNVYPCDFYCVDEWLLGNIAETDFKKLRLAPKARDFISQSFGLSSRCRQCSYYNICRGGACKRNRESADYCEAYKRFFSSCMPLFELFTR